MPKIRNIVLGSVAVVLVAASGAFLISQNASRNDKVNALEAQQANSRAAAAALTAGVKAKADIAAAAAKGAATQAATDKLSADKASQNAAVAQAQTDAADAEAAAAAAAAKPPTVIIQPPTYYPDAPEYYNNYQVWETWPLAYWDHNAPVYVYNSASQSSGYSGLIPAGSEVGIICSVVGDAVSISGVTSSNWDYVTAPSVGWVADAYIDSGGAVAPRCS